MVKIIYIGRFLFVFYWSYRRGIVSRLLDTRQYMLQAHVYRRSSYDQLKNYMISYELK